MGNISVAFCAYDRPGYLAGGPNTWLRRLLQDLREMGFEVHPLVIHSGEVSECPLVGFLCEQGFPVATLARSEEPYVEGQVDWLLRQARKIRPSVFVANLVCPAFYATPWLRRAGIRVVGVFHSDAPFCRAMGERFLGAKPIGCFDAAICVSERIRIQVAAQNSHDRLIKRIPCGAPFMDNAQKSSVNSEVSNLRILYAGRITQDAKRALDVGRAFCKVIRAIPRTRATMVGAGPEEAALVEILSNPVNLGLVEFRGEVEPARMSAIYASHDIFVLLSDYEGLPIALIEAMGCGLVPVCLAEKSGIAEVIEDGVNGLIVSDRDESFVAAIRRLQENPEFLTRLSHNARTTVEREYSSAINHRRWADLLNELAINSARTSVRVPWHLRLPPPEPAFGSEDLRRPPLCERLSQHTSEAWMRLRLTIRPRARLRAWLGFPSPH